MKKFLNVPNVLTISRILLLPFFAMGFYIEGKAGVVISLVIFVFCCITDYLDGYYARAYKQITEIGKMLDPLADKILISISILFISGFSMISKVTLIPAAIILCREIIISGVRDAASESGGDFKTSVLSKWKTASQMIAIILVFLATLLENQYIILLAEVLFWISSLVAIISGFIYCKKHVLL